MNEVARHTHSPRVRRLARTAGVDLRQVVGTGPNGRVRPADVSAAVVSVQASLAAADDVATYVVELDLTSVTTGGRSRAAVLGAVAHALLTAVRHVSPVTDVEIVSAAGTGVIPRAHDLSQAALISRIEAGPAVSAGSSAPTVAIIDAAHAGAVFRIAGPAPGQLLSASLGQAEPRPVVRLGKTSYPDISFHIVAFLGVSCRTADLGAEAVAELLTTVTRLLHNRVRENGTE